MRNSRKRATNERTREGGGRLEVGPRDDVIPRGTIRVLHVDRYAQARCAEGTFSSESFDGFDETPCRDCAELDLARFEDAVAAYNAPTIIVGGNH